MPPPAVRRPSLNAFIYKFGWRAGHLSGSDGSLRRGTARTPRPLRGRRRVHDASASAAAGDVPRELRGEVGGVQDGEPEEAGLVPEPEPVPVDQRRHRRGADPRRGVPPSDRRRRPQARRQRLGRYDHAVQLQVKFWITHTFDCFRVSIYVCFDGSPRIDACMHACAVSPDALSTM
jgi:hypothetical protein